MKNNISNIVKINSFSVNYEAVIEDLTNAFSEVIGLEYKDLISKRLKKVNIINYFTNSHLKHYLENRGIKLDFNNNDEILETFEIEFLNELKKMFPDADIFNRLSKFPISKSVIYDIFGELEYKASILNELGFMKQVQGTAFFTEQEKIAYENNIIQTWNKIFESVDLKKILENSKKHMLQANKEILLNEGNIKECIKESDCIDSSLSNYILEGIVENNRLKCMHIHILKESEEVLPIVLNPILYLDNSEMLLSIIHEITHAIAVEKIQSDEKGIQIKAGLNEYLVNNNNFEKTNNYNYLNEAITQYIATEVTNKLLETNFINKFFNFEPLVQEANLYSSYPGCLLFGKDFIEENRKDLFAAYIENKYYKKLLNTMDLNKVEKLFSTAFFDYSAEEVERLTSKHK